MIYQRVAVAIGEPVPVTDLLRQGYRGKGAGQVAADLSDRCHDKVQSLLQVGCY